jgi:hypothetical protein
MEADADDDGQPDWVETATTAAGTGEYSFPDLYYGRYRVSPVLPAGKAQTSSSPPGLYLFSSFIYVADYEQVDSSDPRFALSEPRLAFGQRDTWQNPADRFDVDGRDGVTAGDVLDLVNYINSHPGNPAVPPSPAVPPPYYDVTGNGFITADDVLQVINEINRRIAGAGEGEAGEQARAAAALGSPRVTQPSSRLNSAHVEPRIERAASAKSIRHLCCDGRLAVARGIVTEKRVPSGSDKKTPRDLDAVFSRWEDLLAEIAGEFSAIAP